MSSNTANPLVDKMRNRAHEVADALLNEIGHDGANSEASAKEYIVSALLGFAREVFEHAAPDPRTQQSDSGADMEPAWEFAGDMVSFIAGADQQDRPIGRVDGTSWWAGRGRLGEWLRSGFAEDHDKARAAAVASLEAHGDRYAKRPRRQS